MEIIRDIDQGTPEWFQLRCGSIGGTAINRIAPKGKGYQASLYALAGEVITGVPSPLIEKDRKVIKNFERGHKYEPIARQAYELRSGESVEQVAAVRLNNPHKHYSPDGLMSGNRFLEIKVRHPNTFIRIKETGEFPKSEKRQIQWGYSFGFDGCVRVQYCPEIDDAGYDGLIVEEVKRDEGMIRELSEVADIFIIEMLEMVNRMKGV